MKRVVLTTEYFGPVSSFAAMAKADQTLVEYCENYQKKSYRNRCRLSSPNDIVTLSVPLKSGKSNQCPISEVEISYDTDWIAEHLQAMMSCYGKSPFYEYFIDDIATILERRYDRLLLLNTALTEFVIQALDVEVKVTPTEDYVRAYDETTTDFRKHHYTNRNKLELVHKPYWQVWSDRHAFEADLSILDLLFCKGREGVLYL